MYYILANYILFKLKNNICFKLKKGEEEKDSFIRIWSGNTYRKRLLSTYATGNQYLTSASSEN